MQSEKVVSLHNAILNLGLEPRSHVDRDPAIHAVSFHTPFKYIHTAYTRVNMHHPITPKHVFT